MKVFFPQFFLMLCLSFSAMASELVLTEEEQNFIASHPVIKVAMMPDFTPFSYKSGAGLVGFEHDLLALISEKTGLRFETRTDKWTSIYNAFKNKEVDMISSISYKEYREPFTLFTSPYYNIPIMIFVKDDFGEYKGLQSLEGKKVGVLKDVFYIEELKKAGDLNLVYYDSYDALTKDLVFGKIDALMQNLPNINHLIKKYLYTNITLASELSLPNTKREDLRFGIQPELPLLSSIVQKTLSAMTRQEKAALSDKWIGSIKEYVGGHILLNKNEIAYVNTNRIKYCINPKGLPFEGLNEKGEHIGMSADYYQLFSQMLSAKFELVSTDSWSQSLEYIQQRRCDMLALGMETPERKSYLNFTSSYLEVPLVVATRVDVPFINHILDLEGEKIGIIRGDAFVDILRNRYPSLELVEVDDINEGLDKVKDGQLFGFIDTLASIGYEFQSQYFGELKIAGKINEKLKLSIAVRNDDETLLAVLQKAVNNITNELHRKILNKWIPIKYEKGIDYKLIWEIVLVALLIVLLLMYWNTKVTKANRLLKQAQKDIEEKNIALERLALTDNLTGLFNRRKLEELLQVELDRKERFERDFCLSILDIDYFKQVNDTFGHQTGDSVLVEVSELLVSSLRKTDYVGRYGGEEFIIIFPESNLDAVTVLLDALRVKIADHGFAEVGSLSASFGFTLSQSGDSIETIIARADEALYRAKEGGRNRVEVQL
ncbi:transporter substrate-binding domain-containing diguanylate cyclase [Aliamphritea hakodatensis]|uniref:transporter substrate-binding domain-containing diguanylate cyclase n=1 Tax=Aliamphritea hakodatensis TaxID=2895352 RepID=UPI0022FD6733|nr:transporter substrate-binding domain-containing protein [Aliamphritea hakodatensis]